MTPPPFECLLVANRGEIAIRIIRACRDLGIETVAVFSDADGGALHVRMADRAVRIGSAAPAESYLNIAAIVDAAVAAGAGAIHPGYGFLAERAEFARAVEAAGIVFVGPTGDVLASLGDKLEARRLARASGVPVVPGTLEPAAVGNSEAVAALVAEAEAIGFPVMVKAAAGGGGRGMRRVVEPAALPQALVTASNEATAAFGDGAVYLEREIVRARHVEVQLLGDVSGGVVAIGERDCSIQRRHQKLVEEAPAPGLAPEERLALHEMAVRLGRAAGLTNAATAEFLLTPEGPLYFLEVNTRLQVEHGITELVSGLDLVREQLFLAAGRPLSRAAQDAADRAASPTRHAIEVRITAEDPARDFAPAPGLVRHWSMPSGPGVRVDAGIEAGGRVAPEYDNLIAKVMVWADTREIAVARLARVLDEVEIAGIQTTLPFHRFVARSPAFRPGDLSTHWVAEHWDGPGERARTAASAVVAAGLAVLAGGPGAAHDRRPAPSAAGARHAGPIGGTGRQGGPDGWTSAARIEGLDRWPR